MAAAIAGSRLLAEASATRVSRIRPIPLAACCAAITTSTLPCAPRPRLPGRGPPMKISSTDDTLQPLTSGTNHRPAQLVQQIPRRAITPQPQHPLQAQGAGPALLAGHVPQRFEPQTQGQMRVREQGPRRHRGLPTAPPAVTQAPRRDPMIRPLTYRAAETFRPPQSGEIVPARHIVLEPIAKFQHRARILCHGSGTTNGATGV